MKKHGSASGSAQNVTDPEHCYSLIKFHYGVQNN
jgi:hypothetical protein